MDQLLAIRVFVRIAESGSFSKTADAMDVPRASASKLVQDLEKHVGARLLQRTTRQVTLTPEGAHYYGRARRLVHEIDQLDESLGSARVQPKGRLRVDIGSSLANILLIPALPAFQARFPELQLDLGVSDRIVDLVGEGVDCVVRGGTLPDSTLIARRLADFEWVTCAAPSYLRARPAISDAASLVEAARSGAHRIVGYFSSAGGRHAALEFERDGRRLALPAGNGVSVNESTAHLNALRAGLGVGQTFRFMADAFIRSGELVELLGDWRRPRQPIQLVYPRTRHLSVKVKVFADWAAQVFGTVDAALDDHAGAPVSSP